METIKCRILVADDSAVMRRIVIRSLALGGIEVTTCHEAENGKEVLRLLEEQDVDLAILDVNMPVMNGYEALVAMRADPRWARTPVITVTTEGSEKRRADLEALGAIFVRKPCTPESLVAAAMNALRGAGHAGIP